MKKIWLCWFLIGFSFFPTLSYGEMDDYAKDYLNELEKSGASIFYSRCNSKINGQYSATLIFEVGKTKGLLMEIKGKNVVNLASVTIGNTGVIIEETHGGAYTYDRVKKLINELVGYKFRLMTPLQRKGLVEIISESNCLNAF